LNFNFLFFAFSYLEEFLSCEHANVCRKTQQAQTIIPRRAPKQLDQDEIIEILGQAKTPEWHAAMVTAKINIF
jgi:hypothetical protein